jgi:putative transposase
MPRPLRIAYGGAKYHVTARGNGRQRIFFGDEDYERFLDQLALAQEKDQVIVYAYCLMPNHYHLFVETPLGNIQRFEQRLNTAYGMYYRYKHRRPGHCFQGRYGAKVVGDDDYVIRLSRYIHLNPVGTPPMKSKSLEERRAYLHAYRWSSLPGYVKEARRSAWVDYRWLKLMAGKTDTGNRRSYRNYVDGMIGERDDVLEAAFAASRYAIGSKEFVEQADAALKEMHVREALFGDAELPVEKNIDISEIETLVAAKYKMEVAELREHGRRVGDAKGVVVELCCMLSGKTQREVARHYGFKTDAGVSRQRRVLREKAQADPSLQTQIRRLSRQLTRESIK